MRQRASGAGRTLRGLLGRPAVLATAAVLAVILGVTLTSSTAQGAARLAVRLAAAAKALPRRAPSAPLLRGGNVFGGTSAVGAVFTMNGSHLGSHLCTGSVVASPRGDLVITAAHCVRGSEPHATYAFAPGYHDGWAPFGIWIVTDVVVDQAWTASANPDDDVAFLVVRQAGRGSRLQDLTGAERLGIGWRAVQVVQVIGYPDDQDWPITCQGTTRAFGAHQMQFDCAGYTNGTSGGPFLVHVNPLTGLGTVIGVIGGYEQGGDTASVSYSPRFGGAVAALYQVAVEQG